MDTLFDQHASVKTNIDFDYVRWNNILLPTYIFEETKIYENYWRYNND